jgi:serine/threonine protein kinase
LKLENVMFATDGTVKLIDFGFAEDVVSVAAAREFEPITTSSPSFSSGGSPSPHASRRLDALREYARERARAELTASRQVSPELLNYTSATGGFCGKAVDMWALGVLAYVMAVGELPFYVSSSFGAPRALELETFRLIRAGRARVPRQPVSVAVWDVITALLQPLLARRLAAFDVLHHPFIVQHVGAPLRAAAPPPPPPVPHFAILSSSPPPKHSFTVQLQALGLKVKEGLRNAISRDSSRSLRTSAAPAS